MIQNLFKWQQATDKTKNSLKARNNLLRSIELNRTNKGVCIECGNTVIIDMLTDLPGFKNLDVNDCTNNGLVQVLRRCLEKKESLLVHSMQASWCLLCECVNKDEPHPMFQGDEIPF